MIKKDATEFKVSVTRHEHRGYHAYLPKPIMEALGNPEIVRFVVRGKRIELEAGDVNGT